jgi:hypothetical protein
MPTTRLAAITTPHNQATGRHLLEGSLPSGNSRIRKVPKSIAVGGRNSESEPTAAGKGIEPGLAIRRPYST